ncbi:Zinc finger family protein / BRCT domain-containing protein, putative isoform 1 [Theobroma cacao]|uniref:Zinc finger family protein / BRCT domain-containing protein, putative isoform 1 n=1 Tax=Theobroma cacao TaxID=3641 RepID=A0A061F9G9_THECC|nr:Zinc finger family protein / BRCT domain-containing protein, putative isoform 1 [Theobroma cacao]
MESVVATVSGYHGSERFNLIKLISHAGANYVGSLSQSTTHLVCWRFEGRKYELAKKLKTIIVNHRWFEDCIKEGKRLPEAPYMLQSGKEKGPLLLEIHDLAKGDALTKKCKVFSDKSNVHDDVRNETIDIGCGGSGLSGWSKSALLDENLCSGLEKIKGCSSKLRSKPFRKSSKEENCFSGRNYFQEISSYRLDRKKHGQSSSDASMPPMRNKRKISKNKELNAHYSTHLMSEERNIHNGSRGTCLAESSQRNGRRLLKNVNREIVVSGLSDSEQECYPPRVHEQYNGVIYPSDHSLDQRTVSLFEIGAPSSYDFSKHRGVDEEIEEVEEIKLWNHQLPSTSSTLPVKDAPSVFERPSPAGCFDAEKESQDVGQIELASRLPNSTELSCVICWTEFSATRGVLPCGHRFCYSCIQDWADHMISSRKTSTCPLCKASFMSITKVEDAAICDQKIFSQTIPRATSTMDVSILPDQERPSFGVQSSSAFVCVKCRCREPEDLLVSCHLCQIRNVHTYCLDPPLLPWTCIHCKDLERLPTYSF